MHTFSPLSHSIFLQESLSSLLFFIHILTFCVFLASFQYFCLLFSLYLILFYSTLLPLYSNLAFSWHGALLKSSSTSESTVHHLLSGCGGPNAETQAWTASICPFMLCCWQHLLLWRTCILATSFHNCWMPKNFNIWLSCKDVGKWYFIRAALRARQGFACRFLVGTVPGSLDLQRMVESRKCLLTSHRTGSLSYTMSSIY